MQDKEKKNGNKEKPYIFFTDILKGVHAYDINNRADDPCRILSHPLQKWF